MSSAGTRERSLKENRRRGRTVSSAKWLEDKGSITTDSVVTDIGKQLTVSESNARSSDGSYRSGGSFYTGLIRDVFDASTMVNSYKPGSNTFYSGPVSGLPPTEAEMIALSYKNISRSFGAKNEAQMSKDGTTAISLCAPTNPASNLGTTLAESVREGIPSLPGIQLWKSKTQFLKGLGSEYLNYQFGWAPLRDEVSSVRDAARNHRDLLQQYHRGEGSDTHREFHFPSQITRTSLPLENPGSWSGPGGEYTGNGTRQVSLIRETKRWFVGVFTYALPSSTDSWRSALGFGSDADALFGIALTPDVLWELTPWSWAVDWFSNAGLVINNVTQFGLAGLAMRYGYAMEETIESIIAEGRTPEYDQGKFHANKDGSEPTWLLSKGSPGGYRRGTECVTKRRAPASPFGFSIGWEGLSPTQLAITAALGITRLL